MDNVGGWDKTQSDGMITIVFPGVTVLDSSIEVIHTGFFHDVQDNVSVVASIKIGADVEEAKVALVQGTDGLAGANDIIGGIVESISVTASGEVKIPMPEDAEDGRYSVVAVSYIGGEAQEYDYATFNYTSGAKEEWTQIAVGTYTYAYFWTGDDEGLALFRSQNDPTRYKIENWGGGVDFIFTMTDDGSVMVADQEVGYVYESYGDVYVDDLVDFTGSTENGVSSYADGVFTFNVIYYVGSGDYFGYGPETFTITATAQAPSKRAPANYSGKKLNQSVAGITKQQLMHNRFLEKACLLK